MFTRRGLWTETGVGPHQPRVGSVEDVVEAALLADRLDDRSDSALELVLQLLLQFLDFLLRVLRGPLQVDLRTLHLLGQIAAGRFAHHGAALVELLLEALESLLPLVELGHLLGLKGLHLGAGLLAVARFGDHALQDDKRDFGALGKRQHRRGSRRRRGRDLGGRCGRLGGARRRGLGERSGGRRDDEANGQNHTSHC
jgi:hypothetical protein